MLVFFNERLVFLSVPKTGSTAYQTALSERADWIVSNPPELKHAPLYRYDRFFRPIFEKVCSVQMEVLAVMREPTSWLGSWYRYRKRPFLQGKPESTSDLSFEAFVAAYTKGNRPAFANVGSQARFLEAKPGGTTVTHLFRYEEPDKLHRFLEQRLGPIPAPARENVSPKASMELSDAMKAKLRRKCARDFALYESIG